MDSSKDPNASQQGAHARGSSSRKDVMHDIQRRAEEKQQNQLVIQEKIKPYLPYAKTTMESSFPDRESVWHSIMGNPKAAAREVGTMQLAQLCAFNGRELERPVADAIAETIRSMLNVSTAVSWVVYVGVSMVVLRKNRAALRNLYPKSIRPSETAGNDLSGKKKLYKPALDMLWYGFIGFGFVEPAVKVFSAQWHEGRFRRDPRLQGLKLSAGADMQAWREGFKQAGMNSGEYQGQGQPSTYGDEGASTGSWQADSKPQIAEQATSWRQQDTDAQNTAAWSQGPTGQGTSWEQSSPPIQENSSWGSSDPIDDASPQAPSASPQRPGESSWDRLRRQAGVQSRQSQQGRQPPPSQGGWGENTGASAQFGASSRSASDDYSYSSADFQKSAEKDRAQREFDQMLDQERKGADLENKRWR